MLYSPFDLMDLIAVAGKEKQINFRFGNIAPLSIHKMADPKQNETKGKWKIRKQVEKIQPKGVGKIIVDHGRIGKY